MAMLITLADKHAKIDLGGIAKGYIADRVKDYLKKKGVKHATINLGGNDTDDWYQAGWFGLSHRHPEAIWEKTAKRSLL